MLLPWKPKQEDEKEEKEESKEEEEVETSSNLHLISDDTELDDIDDDITEESCVGKDNNLRSKVVPKTKYSPSTSKMTTISTKI